MLFIDLIFHKLLGSAQFRSLLTSSVALLNYLLRGLIGYTEIGYASEGGILPGLPRIHGTTLLPLPSSLEFIEELLSIRVLPSPALLVFVDHPHAKINECLHLFILQFLHAHLIQDHSTHQLGVLPQRYALHLVGVLEVGR